MRHHRLHTFIRRTFANPAQLAYLGLTAATGLFILFAWATEDVG
ncbi:hypothetical protein Q5762_03695 [Streptomyces sp. P9(2023)]|nr:hypothetical protein [Streptomyces sp. P9(2023)]MDT9687457.1 hypothetical protein [Streptomyces sp. P9(2023)]